MNAIIRLIRPSNFIIASLSIAVACVLAGGTTSQWLLIAAAACSGALIGAAGMVINDIFDVEIDRINKPERPLPRGEVTIARAKLLYLMLNGAGVLLTALLPAEAQAIAIGAILLIYLYSAVLKRTVLAGNLAVGVMTGLTFIYGGAAVGGIDRALLPALFALLMNLGREIIKDMEDVEGDRR
ncbi:MAG TPA: geranylgeranylglycerol-phosphate geranylgeranyltransferase, partial [Bacteroidota bacterium]|nr:geranylgeranylglycerol-phosphate geranylgeranyltransferase [Bacteroidota bacterium]